MFLVCNCRKYNGPVEKLFPQECMESLAELGRGEEVGGGGGGDAAHAIMTTTEWEQLQWQQQQQQELQGDMAPRLNKETWHVMA